MPNRGDRRAQADDLHHLSAEQRSNWPRTLVGYIMQWAVAVEEMHDRLTDRPTALGGWSDNTWAAILADALRQLFRAVDLARRTTEGSTRDAITTAIADFEKTVPDAVQARDIVEHFDDYAIGAGDLQQPARTAGRQPFPPAHIWTYTFDPTTRRYQLDIGGGYTIDTAATGAALKMAAEVADILIPDVPETSGQAAESTIENMETDSRVPKLAEHAKRQA